MKRLATFYKSDDAFKIGLTMACALVAALLLLHS